MEEAIKRQIQSYKKLVASFEEEQKNEDAVAVKSMIKGQILILRYVIRDLENVLTLFDK